jgi:hypothetical protein
MKHKQLLFRQLKVLKHYKENKMIEIKSKDLEEIIKQKILNSLKEIEDSMHSGDMSRINYLHGKIDSFLEIKKILEDK